METRSAAGGPAPPAAVGRVPLYLAVGSFVACAALAFFRPYATWEWIPAVAGLAVFGFMAARRYSRQPYPNAAPALVLAVLIPGYHVIAAIHRDNPSPNMPAIFLDGAIPVEPAWMLAYGSIWVFAFLPVLVVRGAALTRRALYAFIAVVIAAYVGFLFYPTAMPRPASVGEGFFAWALALNYDLDPPLNCFPSLHVAWGFVAALCCYCVHKGVGIAALAWATLIAISTLYTKQHYVLDVVAGVAIAALASFAFLRGAVGEAVAERELRLAPRRALRIAWIYGAVVIASWVTYRLAS